MSFPCVVFINSVAFRIVVFLINTIFETLKSNKGLWDFFCQSTDENSILVINTLMCCGKFNVFSFLLLNMLFNIIADAFYPAWHFGKVDFSKCKAALNFYRRGFLISTLSTYLGSPISHHLCPVRLTRAGGMLSFCTLHMSLQLRWHFRDTRLKVRTITLEQSKRHVWGYKATWHRPGGLQRGDGAKPGIVLSILPFGNGPCARHLKPCPGIVQRI